MRILVPMEASGTGAPAVQAEPRHRLRLDSIRNQIIAFAVLAALIPAISIAAIAYQQSRQALVQSIADELSSASTQAAREVGLWAKERLYDLRVYTGSYEVLENLERARSQDRAARGRLTGYLDAIRGRTGDYELLAVTDLRGTVAALSAARGAAPGDALAALPPDWLAAIRQDAAAVGTPFWDEGAGKAVVTFAVPVTTGNGRVLGAIAARSSLAGATELLGSTGRGGAREVYVVTDSGRFVIGSSGGSAALMQRAVPSEAFGSLSAREGEQTQYTDDAGREMAAVLHRVPRSTWSILAQIPWPKRMPAWAACATSRSPWCSSWCSVSAGLPTGWGS